MRMGIVGAGMAGLACAEGLAAAGHELVLVDKGRGPGGRMSTRRMATVAGDAYFDHGAQYFTVRDEGFRRRMSEWIAVGAAAAWPAADGTATALTTAALPTAATSTGRTAAFVGVPGMNSLVRQMADALSIQATTTVRWSTRVTRIETLARGWRLVVDAGGPIDAVRSDGGRGDEGWIDVDGVVIALPAEQAAELLAPVAADLAALASRHPSQPCWTAMLAFAEHVAVGRDCWRVADASEGAPAIGWAARNNSKPGRSGPESWVVQASPEWSARNLDADAEGVGLALQQALSTLLDIDLPPLLGRASHRWRYARSGAAGSGAIWDSNRQIGLCGDWLIGPRVEAAWLSGTKLAAQVMRAR